MELMQANRQWSSRPDDERFTSLPAMARHFHALRNRSVSRVVSTRSIACEPSADGKGLVLTGKSGRAGYAPTHFAFGQLATLAEAPAGYLRTLPPAMAADCVNYGLRFRREAEEVGILAVRDAEGDGGIVRAATGPRYGRIWNADVVDSLVNAVGDGVTGRWRVPGEWKRDIVVDKSNTTLFAGDRDMFVFLADEKNRIEISNRRNGEAGSLARGFFGWNSEVGSATFGVATFLFDEVCKNRIVWSATQFKQIKIRHTTTAPDRWVEELRPALLAYAESSDRTVIDTVEAARAKKVDDVEAFLASRFGKRTGPQLNELHMLEEGRPIETLWDVTTAVTARARSLPNQDERVALERMGGDILDLVAA